MTLMPPPGLDTYTYRTDTSNLVESYKGLAQCRRRDSSRQSLRTGKLNLFWSLTREAPTNSTMTAGVLLIVAFVTASVAWGNPISAKVEDREQVSTRPTSQKNFSK